MTHIYVLQLVQGKYYVGASNDYRRRYEQHLNKQGSAWTSKYPPIEIVEVLESTGLNAEDNHTLKYMQEYGIDNVRGGSFVAVRLSSTERDVITRMLNSRNDSCFKCGKRGHYAQQCKSKYCQRCGRNSHWTQKCYAHTDINGNKILPTQKQCERCGRKSHLTQDCYANTDINGHKLSREGAEAREIINNVKKDDDILYWSEFDDTFEVMKECERCGRSSHVLANCYAQTDVNGYELASNDSNEGCCIV